MHTQATVQWEFSKSCPDTRRKVGVFGGSRRPPTRGPFISKRLRVMEARWAHPDPGVRPAPGVRLRNRKKPPTASKVRK